MKFIDEDIWKKILSLHGESIRVVLVVLVTFFAIAIWGVPTIWLIEEHQKVWAAVYFVTTPFVTWVVYMYYTAKRALIRDARQALERASKPINHW